MDEPHNERSGNADSEPNDGSGNGTQKSEAEIRAELEADFRTKFESLITNNEAYKSMQKVVSGKDREIQQLRQKMQELDASRESLSEGFDFLSDNFMRALPDEERERVKAELQNRRLANIEKALQQRQAPQPQQQQWEQPQPDWQAQWDQIRRDAQDSLEDTVKSFGLDPKAKGLEYGSDGDPFPARLKKLNASIITVKKALEEAEVDSVRKKKEQPETRTNGGGAPGDESGKTLSDQAFSEMWRTMQDPNYRAERLAGRTNSRTR